MAVCVHMQKSLLLVPLNQSPIVLLLQGEYIVLLLQGESIVLLLQGEYIAPEKIENIYIRSEAVGQIMVHGDSLKVGHTVNTQYCSTNNLMKCRRDNRDKQKSDQAYCHIEHVSVQRLHDSNHCIIIKERFHH